MPNQIKLIFDLLIDWRIIFCGNLLICQKSVSYFHILLCESPSINNRALDRCAS